MDQNDVKQSFDAFEADDFITSKEILQNQIHKAKNDFLKAKLDLKGDIDAQFTEVKPPEVKPEPKRLSGRKKKTE